MSSTVTSRSPDLRRLAGDGYDIEIREGFLLVRDVPYLNSEKAVCRGTLVSALDLAGDLTARPSTHVIYFAGEHPCRLDGSRVANIMHGSRRQALARGVVVDHSFSNKPPAGYADYYEKITRYVTIIENEAQAVDSSVTARVGRVIEPAKYESVFEYLDTASSRAKINAVSEKLKGLRVAAVGVGGTGSYILDFVAKTPVAEIHLYDSDKFFQHNAFRAPGAATVDELRQQLRKVDYLRAKYSAMHRGIVVHSAVDQAALVELRGMDFVFIAMDGGDPMRQLVEALEESQVPYVIAGMGLSVIDGTIQGQLCLTTSTATTPRPLRNRGRVSFSDAAGAYDTNIQIADLNALNAALAVIKWKKLFGLYLDLDRENHCVYTLSGNAVINGDRE